MTAIMLWCVFSTSLTTFMLITWFLYFYLRSHSVFTKVNKAQNLDAKINIKIKKFYKYYISRKGLTEPDYQNDLLHEQQIEKRLEFFSKKLRVEELIARRGLWNLL